MRRLLRPLPLLLLLLTGCAPTPPQKVERGKFSSDFKISSLAKTDLDVVAEIHQQETFSHLRTLMEKLYRRNPREWRKSGRPNPESIVALVFDTRHDWRFREIEDKRGAEAIQLAFREDFQGDRVLAFIVGLSSMMMASYNDKTEFFVLDELVPQKLYNSARNVEIAAWKLSNARDSRGELLLVSNETEGTLRNLSFEREFGKIIAYQDAMARIIAEKTNRTVARMIQSVATAVFLPI